MNEGTELKKSMAQAARDCESLLRTMGAGDTFRDILQQFLPK